jgi:hypothetical protein
MPLQFRTIFSSVELAAKSFIVGLPLSYMTKYLVKGKIKDDISAPIADLHLQAMDSDQQLFEDHNDDLLGSSKSTSDGSFEIAIDDSAFKDNWLEKNPEIYLIVRNEHGHVIHRTETIKFKSDENVDGTITIPANITIDQKQQQINLPSTNVYWNNQRILSAFSSIGDTITLNNSEFQRNFTLLISSINAWLIYTNEVNWRKIGYDGPQVPRFPWRVPNHSHKLAWE